MKKNILIIVISIIIFILGIYYYYYSLSIVNNNNPHIEENTVMNSISNTQTIMKAVVLEIYEDKNQLLISNNKNEETLIYIDSSTIDISKFEKGQEIIIYYDNMINTSYSEEKTNIKKIEILTQKNNTTISNLEDNIIFEINEFNINEFIFTVTDKDKIPYTYLTNYDIYISTENNNNNKLQNATNNSTSLYKR